MITYRQNTILYDQQSKPNWGAAYRVIVYPVGGIASAISTGSTITLHQGHSFRVGDKFLLNPGVDNIFSVAIDSVTDTTITFNSSTYTIAVGDKLVNLGPDSGVSSPAYTASSMELFSDPRGNNAITNATINCSNIGEYDYYYLGSGRAWELVLNANLVPADVITGFGGSPGVFNVCDYGAKTDGVTDASDAIAAALASVPQSNVGWATDPDNTAAFAQSSRPSDTYTVFFPTPIVSYRVETQVDIPARKNIALKGEGVAGSRLQWEGAGNFIFDCLTTDHALEFEGLVFHKGGIEIQTSVKSWNTIRDCHFQGTKGFAIDTQGISIFDMEISRCNFTECAGGINVDQTACDLWAIRHCKFWRNTDVDIVIGSGSMLVEKCDFEVRGDPENNYTKPHIQFVNPAAAGGSRVFNCRFGNETSGNGDEPPRECILLGVIDTVSETAFQDVQITNCQFLGHNAGGFHGQGANSGNVAIRMNHPAKRLVIAHNQFREYNTAIVQEYYYDDDVITKAYAQQCYDNVWVGNTVKQDHEGNIFSEGGVGFYPLNDLAPGTPDLGMDMQIDPDLTAWTLVTATIAKTATGPTGQANSAFLYTASADANSASDGSAITSVGGQGACFSIDVKPGTSNIIRIGIRALGLAEWIASNLATVYLRPGWQRIHVVAPVVPAGLTLQAWIHCGPDGGSNNGLTLNLANPKLEEGLGPTDLGRAEVFTLTDGDTTPDVQGLSVVKTGNTSLTTITDFDGGIIGQKLTVIFGDSLTDIDFTGTNLKGNGGADLTAVTSNDHMDCVYDGTSWFCNFSDNTA